MLYYPQTRLDQVFNALPGGSAIMHQIGVVQAAFRESVLPPAIKALKAKVAEDIKPVADRLAAISADNNGRKWKTYIFTKDGLLGDEPEIEVTFGHFNKEEERAFLFFQRNGGSATYPGNGVRWTEISARSYDVTVPTDRGDGRPVYKGMLPSGENTLKQKSSHRFDSYANHFIDKELPRITALGNFQPRTPTAAPG